MIKIILLLSLLFVVSCEPCKENCDQTSDSFDYSYVDPNILNPPAGN